LACRAPRAGFTGATAGRCSSARILDRDGNDLTESFIAGAEKALLVAHREGIKAALLNERSPSCGVREVYVGQDKVPGMGVLTAMLVKEGVRVQSDEEPFG
jgi:uncharacterized protein YbbK (DUF523 family)